MSAVGIDISLGEVAASLVLVALAIAVSFWRRTELEGDIAIAVVRSLDPLELRRQAVLVPQLPAPLPGTVAENVRYGPRLCGGDCDLERALRLAGLDADYGEREAGRLSVGEQQRVMLARALALDPQVLLLDEPTSALDEEARDGVEATVAMLVRELGVSAVVVTHDRAQADRLASRTIALEAAE